MPLISSHAFPNFKKQITQAFSSFSKRSCCLFPKTNDLPADVFTPRGKVSGQEIAQAGLSRVRRTNANTGKAVLQKPESRLSQATGQAPKRGNSSLKQPATSEAPPLHQALTALRSASFNVQRATREALQTNQQTRALRKSLSDAKPGARKQKLQGMLDRIKVKKSQSENARKTALQNAQNARQALLGT